MTEWGTGLRTVSPSSHSFGKKELERRRRRKKGRITAQQRPTKQCYTEGLESSSSSWLKITSFVSKLHCSRKKSKNAIKAKVKQKYFFCDFGCFSSITKAFKIRQNSIEMVVKIQLKSCEFESFEGNSETLNTDLQHVV